MAGFDRTYHDFNQRGDRSDAHLGDGNHTRQGDFINQQHTYNYNIPHNDLWETARIRLLLDHLGHPQLQTILASEQELWLRAKPLPLYTILGSGSHKSMSASLRSESSDGIPYVTPAEAKKSFNKLKQQLEESEIWNLQYNEPYYLFFRYSLPKEREQIQENENNVTPDISTRAYYKVKETWKRRGFWDPHWDLLPGTEWPWKNDGTGSEKHTSIADPPPKSGRHKEPAAFPVPEASADPSPIQSLSVRMKRDQSESFHPPFVLNLRSKQEETLETTGFVLLTRSLQSPSQYGQAQEAMPESSPMERSDFASGSSSAKKKTAGKEKKDSKRVSTAIKKTRAVFNKAGRRSQIPSQFQKIGHLYTPSSIPDPEGNPRQRRFHSSDLAIRPDQRSSSSTLNFEVQPSTSTPRKGPHH